VSIPNNDKKIKIIVLIAIVVVLGFFAAFGSLKLYAKTRTRTPVVVIKTPLYEEIAAKAAHDQLARETSQQMSQSSPTEPAEQVTGQTAGQVVASKTGTKYHLPSCPGAKQISAKNLVVFESIEAAKRAGLTAAANCPGLQQ
jgi:hypothetical protein